jgi:hypothetical protein
MELGLLGLIHLGLIIYAILKTVESGASTGAKVIWILVVIAFPILGFILWLIFGPR